MQTAKGTDSKRNRQQKRGRQKEQTVIAQAIKSAGNKRADNKKRSRGDDPSGPFCTFCILYGPVRMGRASCHCPGHGRPIRDRDITISSPPGTWPSHPRPRYHHLIPARDTAISSPAGILPPHVLLFPCDDLPGVLQGSAHDLQHHILGDGGRVIEALLERTLEAV